MHNFKFVILLYKDPSIFVSKNKVNCILPKISNLYFMKEFGDWGFYICILDENTAAVSVDLSLINEAPFDGFPHLITLQVGYTDADEDKMPTEAAYHDLQEIDTALEELVKEKEDVIYAGILTHNMANTHYFYSQNPDNKAFFEQFMNQVFPSHQSQITLMSDKDWEAYTDLLYPDDICMQNINNERIIEAMKESGIDTEAIHKIDHWVYFQSEEELATFAGELGELNIEEALQFETENEEWPWGLKLTVSETLDADAINDFTVDLMMIAEETNGLYNGWGLATAQEESTT